MPPPQGLWNDFKERFYSKVCFNYLKKRTAWVGYFFYSLIRFNPISPLCDGKGEASVCPSHSKSDEYKIQRGQLKGDVIYENSPARMWKDQPPLEINAILI